jgi:hypothetical protein
MTDSKEDAVIAKLGGRTNEHALIEPAMLVAEPAAATPSIRCKRRIRHYPPANVDSCPTRLATSELGRMFLQLGDPGAGERDEFTSLKSRRTHAELRS